MAPWRISGNLDGAGGTQAWREQRGHLPAARRLHDGSYGGYDAQGAGGYGDTFAGGMMYDQGGGATISFTVTWIPDGAEGGP